MLISICSVLLFFTFSCVPAAQKRLFVSQTPPQNTLRVMSLNIAHGRGKHFHQLLLRKKQIQSQLNQISDLLHQTQPNLVALQELDGTSMWSGSFDHITDLKNKTHLKYTYRGTHVRMPKLDYGTGVMSSLPITKGGSHIFSPRPPLPNKGFVWVDIDDPEYPKGLRVVSVHLDFARKGVRSMQLEELKKALVESDRSLIIMGDFNMEWTPMLISFCSELQLHTYAPLEKGTTFPKTRKRLDWILVSKEIRFSSYQVLPHILSDHKAIMADLIIEQSM